MGTNTKIAWAGDTWNPHRAVLKEGEKAGWMCVPRGPGCAHCYADAWNQFRGNGLPYAASSFEKVKLEMDIRGGQTSIDWPLRSHGKSRTIFLDSMTDWMGEFYPAEWQSLTLAVMTMASWHTFITLTKRWENLVAMLYKISSIPNRVIDVPADTAFTSSLLRANAFRNKYDLSGETLLIRANVDQAQVAPKKKLSDWQTLAEFPWLPRNVIFGISVCTIEEADKAIPYLMNVRKTWPDIKLAVSQEPALDKIDWLKLGLPKNTVDWIIWGGESGDGARPASIDGWEMVLEYGKETGTNVFFKQTGEVLARQLGLASKKGDDTSEEKLVDAFGGDVRQEFLDMSGSLL